MSKDIQLPRCGFLFIGNEVPNVRRARIFDPAKHSFNPLKSIDYKKAREPADVLYTIAEQGENTLTVRNGKRTLLKALLASDWLDKLQTQTHSAKAKWKRKDQEPDDEVGSMITDLLVWPVLRRVLCNPTNFSFAPNSMILAG
jgi:hypothetical protein